MSQRKDIFELTQASAPGVNLDAGVSDSTLRLSVNSGSGMGRCCTLLITEALPVAVIVFFTSIQPVQALPISDSFTSELMGMYYVNEQNAMPQVSTTTGRSHNNGDTAHKVSFGDAHSPTISQNSVSWEASTPDNDDSDQRSQKADSSNLALREQRELDHAAEEKPVSVNNDTGIGTGNVDDEKIDWSNLDGITFSISNTTEFSDNYFGTETNQVSNFYNIITPRIMLKGSNNVLDFEGIIETSIGLFKTDTADNYIDNSVKTKIGVQLSENVKVNISNSIEMGHDARGSDDDVEDSDTPHRFIKPTFGADLEWGDQESIFSLKMSSDISRLRYLNHPDTTNKLEKVVSSGKIALTWAPGPEKTFVAGIELQGNTYDALAEKDSQDVYYYAGMNWNPSDLFAVESQFGVRGKRFDDVNTPSFMSFAWNVGVDWMPMEYSKYSITTSMSTGDSTGSADLYSTQDVGLSWDHEWTEDFSTKLQTKYSWKSSEGTGQTRIDKTWTKGANFNYSVDESINLALKYDRTDLQSTTEGENYQKNMVVLSVESEL